MKKGIKVILLVLTLALFIFSIVLIVLSSKNSQIASQTLNQELYSKYISEDDVDTSKTVVIDNPEEPKEKIGEIQEDISRQVIKVDRILSNEEILSLEEKYDVEFTEDTQQSGVYVVNVSEDTDLDELESESFVESVETDIPIKMFADTVDWGVTKIGADKVWTYSTGLGVKVAVIDTGIQLDHPDLGANVVSGYDFVNNDQTAMDDNGHGTHVAGIVAATSNGTGSVGVGYTVSLMPVKVLNSAGYGYLSDVAKGIYYAADNGARIINMSLGSSSDSYVLKDAVSYAYRKGVLIVAAAGNDYGSPCSYPAAYSEVVCVVATDRDNRLASFSNIGGELSAPGVSNYSTYLGSTYKSLSGTSMATPHVVGAAAVLMSKCTTCSASDIRNDLRESAIDLGDIGKDIIFGYGLVDLNTAMSEYIVVEEPVEEPTPEEPTTPTPTPTEEKKINYVNQDLVIVEPVKERNNRYIPTVYEDIVLKFTLNPSSETSDLSKIVVYLDNNEVYSTTDQSGEYTFKIEELTNTQYSVKIRAMFNSGKVSQDILMLDLTNIQINSFTNHGKRGGVLGIADFILSLFNF